MSRMHLLPLETTESHPSDLSHLYTQVYGQDMLLAKLRAVNEPFDRFNISQIDLVTLWHLNFLTLKFLPLLTFWLDNVKEDIAD